MTRWISKSLAILPMTATLMLAAATGDGSCQRCERCGCECACQRTCRLVCEMKETAKVTYGCKTEDICVPGPSRRCAAPCGCGNCSACRQSNWVPTVAFIKTRKVPVKQEERVQQPTYKWVVEYLCPACAECDKSQ